MGEGESERAEKVVGGEDGGGGVGREVGEGAFTRGVVCTACCIESSQKQIDFGPVHVFPSFTRKMRALTPIQSSEFLPWEPFPPEAGPSRTRSSQPAASSLLRGKASAGQYMFPRLLRWAVFESSVLPLEPFSPEAGPSRTRSSQVEWIESKPPHSAGGYGR